jgi:hypothetical protein
MTLLLLLVGCGSGVTTGKSGPRIGESCVDEACASGLVCANDGTCAAPGDLGTTLSDGDCSATVECAYGLVCDADNTCASPGDPGTGAAGASCSSDDDCQAGHYCGDDGICVDVGIPFWEGGECPADLDGDFYPLFDVPNLPASGQIDFFSLPFPNDARLDLDGRPDLSGFPDPGDVAPAVGEVLAAVSGGPTGYGLNPTVYFRFSRPQDLDSITVLTDDATVWWASIDEDADDYGVLPALQYFTRNSRGKYICQNWLAVSVYDGQPLEPNHTYAVWLTKDIHSRNGATAVRDDGFKVMMGDERPTDLSLARAWDAYAPFRDYVAREGIASDRIAGAAVFTTGDPSRGVRYFREVTEGDDVSVGVSDLVECDDGVASPCDDGGVRTCGSGSAAFDELQGRVSVPVYRTDSGVAYDASTFRPTVQGNEDVCFAMTLPKGDMPAGGWPVAFYAGDPGGSFRDAVDGGVAEALAAQGFATITLELPGQGERGTAYYDAAHPAAWLGNELQAAADPNALVRLANEWSLAAAESPTGAEIRFDPANLWYVGEGEGASVGVDFLAWSLDARGGVLGNAAGYQIHAFGEQTAPVDIAHGLQAALADSALNRWHPMLNLVQEMFEPVDPVNYARSVVRDPRTGAKSVLFVTGVEDAETPEVSLTSVLTAAALPTVGDVLLDYDQSTTSYPVYENISDGADRVTAAAVQVAAGHDALLEAGPLDQAARFLGSGTAGQPTIEE